MEDFKLGQEEPFVPSDDDNDDPLLGGDPGEPGDPPAGDPPAGDPPANGNPPAGDPPAGDPPGQDNEIDISDITGGKFKSPKELYEAFESAQEAASKAKPLKDDFIRGLVEFYEANGDVSAYIKEASINYGEMAAEELFRLNLREQYADLSDAAFERLYQRELAKHGLDEEVDEEDQKINREIFEKQVVNPIRQARMEKQKSFLAPERKPNPDDEKLIEDFTKMVNESSVTRDLKEKKQLVVEFNGEKFAYETENPDLLMEATMNNSKIFELAAGEDGNLDLAKWYKAIEYLSNPQKFEQSLISHGISLGIKQLSDRAGLDNPDPGAGGGTDGMSEMEALGLAFAKAAQSK